MRAIRTAQEKVESTLVAHYLAKRELRAAYDDAHVSDADSDDSEDDDQPQDEEESE